MNKFTHLLIISLFGVSVGLWNSSKENDKLNSYVKTLESNQKTLVLHNIKKTDLNWLALNIYHEARGESLDGMLAVGAVTLNRVESNKYPDTIEGVVKQRNQFSWFADNKSNRVVDAKAWETSKSVAKILLTNDRLKIRHRLDGVLFYHSTNVNPSWSRKMQAVTVIGNHKFYM